MGRNHNFVVRLAMARSRHSPSKCIGECVGCRTRTPWKRDEAWTASAMNSICVARWRVPLSERLENLPGVRLRARHFLRRQPVRKCRLPGARRSGTATVLVRWLCVRSVDTREAPICSFAGCPSSGWCARLQAILDRLRRATDTASSRLLCLLCSRRLRRIWWDCSKIRICVQFTRSA